MNPYNNCNNLEAFLAKILNVIQQNKDAKATATSSLPRLGILLREYMTSLVPEGKRIQLTATVDDAINLTLRASHRELIQETQAVIARERVLHQGAHPRGEAEDKEDCPHTIPPIDSWENLETDESDPNCP